MFFLGDLIYLAILYLCLFFSLWNKKKVGSTLYIYFLFVAVLETFGQMKFVGMNRIYSFATLFYIGFFTHYYRSLSTKFPIVFIAGLLSAISCVYFILVSDQSFPIGLAMTLAAFYIFISLMWIFIEVKENKHVLITQKESFWVSFALLFWSICFVFRILPMYWLEKNDTAFLIILAKAFKVAIIITYILFLVAVTRKKNYIH